MKDLLIECKNFSNCQSRMEKTVKRELATKPVTPAERAAVSKDSSARGKGGPSNGGKGSPSNGGKGSPSNGGKAALFIQGGGGQYTSISVSF